MSDLIVEICKIKEVNSHPNADKLELVVVKGWQTAAPIGRYKVGDKVLYIPSDAILPKEFSDEIGVTKYLSKQRVKTIKLRGEMSFGIVTDAKDYPEGVDLKGLLKITKWDPPVKYDELNNETWRDSFWGKVLHYWHIFLYKKLGFKQRKKYFAEGPFFHRYTDIQNIRNYPDIFKEGEEVIFSEKLHGTNSRVGYIKEGKKFKYYVGSHKRRRYIDSNDIYSLPLTSAIKIMFKELSKEGDFNSIILFSEIYGGNIQDLKYGSPNEKKFRAFDISINGRYMDFDDFASICVKYGIPMVPILYQGPYNDDARQEYTKGDTVISGDHIREGIVIKPFMERTTIKLDRVILKSINNDYLMRKEGTEYH